MNEKVFRTKGKGIVEDSTEYGEFVASFDAWLTPEEQKKRVRHLENLKKKRENKKRIRLVSNPPLYTF